MPAELGPAPSWQPRLATSSAPGTPKEIATRAQTCIAQSLRPGTVNAPQIVTSDIDNGIIVAQSAGGAIGSVAGTAAFEAFGWTGTALYALVSCIGIAVLSVSGLRRYGARVDHS